MVRVVDFESFAAERGVGGSFYSEPGMHNPMGFIPKAAQRRHMALLAKRSAEHDARRADAWREYQALVDAGEIRPRTSLERLQDVAAGPDDSERVQAARRTLARRLARMAETQK